MGRVLAAEVSMIRHFAAALALCLAVVACASSRTIGDSANDIGALTQLKRTLLFDRSYDYSDVDLTLYEGRLLLTGTMRAEEGRRQVVENAWKADGVKQVIDEIIVGEKTSFGQGVADSRIEAALRSKIVRDDDLRSGDYKIAVSGGVVYLIGVTRDQATLDGALIHAREIGGVSRVVTHVVFRDLY